MKQRDERKLREAAKEYVDRQLKVMKDHGLETTDLSKAEYDALVEDVTETAKS